MTRAPDTRRVVVVPLYTISVAIATVLLLCGLTLWAGVAISRRNAAALVAQNEADKLAAQQANRTVYCKLFGSQLDAFEDAQSPAGKASRQAWLDVYRLVRCTPTR